MSGAEEALLCAARGALRGVAGIGGVHEPGPVRAGVPHAIVDAGGVADWSHKSGVGREIRIAVTIRDQGESAARLRGLADAAEAAIGEIDGDLGGWRVVTLTFLRRRTVREARGGWAAVIEFRARMLKN